MICIVLPRKRRQPLRWRPRRTTQRLAHTVKAHWRRSPISNRCSAPDAFCFYLYWSVNNPPPPSFPSLNYIFPFSVYANITSFAEFFCLNFVPLTFVIPFNPFASTRRKTVTHFCRFLTVLEYYPIGVKFPLITAPRTLYTVKNNIGQFSKLFLFWKFECP